MLFHLVSSTRITGSVHFKESPSTKNHGLLKLQIVQTVLVILHSTVWHELAACLTFMDYSVMEGCGWAMVSIVLLIMHADYFEQ